MRALPLAALILLAACNGGKDEDDTGPIDTVADQITGATGLTGGDEDCDPVTNPSGCLDTENGDIYFDCSAYEFNGQVYNCELLDICNIAEDPNYALACCMCDSTEYCIIDPNELAQCPPPPDTGGPPPPTPPVPPPPNACMSCHNGATIAADYSGPGTTNPHPFGQAGYILCNDCHGGNVNGQGQQEAHVPRPPEIGDDANLINDPEAYFNYLTRAGLDKFPDYTVNGVTYTALDYIQFMNPGDYRIVGEDRGCGLCHQDTVAGALNDPMAGATGFYSATLYTSGVSNEIPQQGGLYYNTAADYANRAHNDVNWTYNDPANAVGSVGTVKEHEEYAAWDDNSGFRLNPIYADHNTFADFLINADNVNVYAGKSINQIIPGTPLEHALKQVVNGACGDCHFYANGANNRYADFRSSGCSACHMATSRTGESLSSDQNLPKFEPADADQIAAPERSHLSDHTIRNVFKVDPYYGVIRGQEDDRCVGCHQGSNRTVLQYWGIRLDQNQWLANEVQYPEDPFFFQDTDNDQRLYPYAANRSGNTPVTFNGRIAAQYILEEDYDNDQADDTPPDVHYEVGMGCIDCHGYNDMHNMHRDPVSAQVVPGQMVSRESQSVFVRCESCHGTIDTTATYGQCEDYDGLQKDCALDADGNALRNVVREADGSFYLKSKVDGNRHYVPQTYDVTHQNTDTVPGTATPIWSAEAAYAHGRTNDGTFEGVRQTNINIDPYWSHTDDLDCNSCHAAWQNGCMGCHLQTILDVNPANFFFSNATGERIATNFDAQFVYQTPILFNIGVGPRGKITNMMPGMKSFFEYFDNPDDNNTGNGSGVFAFNSVNDIGNSNIPPRGAFGALAHNRISSHSVRGEFKPNEAEGVHGCNTCHLNTDMVDDAAVFADFVDLTANLANRDYAAYFDNNFAFMATTGIGLNTGNQNNVPHYVHGTVGLGTGLYAFDANGCPVNPADDNADLFPCNNVAPQDQFDPDNVAYDLDRIVEQAGAENASNAHPFLQNPSALATRGGAIQPFIAGPLGASTLTRLVDPNFAIILDSWLDADGAPQGDAANFCPQCQ